MSLHTAPERLVCDASAFQEFVDLSIACGFVRNSCEEDTSQKLASSFMVLYGFPACPCFARGEQS